MDASALTQLGAYSNVATLLAVIGLGLYKCLKHSRCRSRCLGGKETLISVDLEEALNTPRSEKGRVSVADSVPQQVSRSPGN